MELNDILISGKPGRKTGFKAQGGSPFTRFCRYSYPENSSFNKAFSSGKAKLLNEVDVYPEGVIIVRNFNGSAARFIVEGVEPLMAGKRIKRQDFENFIDNLAKMASERAKKSMDLHVMAQNNKIIIIDKILPNFIKTLKIISKKAPLQPLFCGRRTLRKSLKKVMAISWIYALLNSRIFPFFCSRKKNFPALRLW